MTVVPMSGITSIELFDAPRSLNEVGARGAPRVFHRLKKAWQKDMGMLMLAAGVPRPLDHVAATAIIRFPQRRKRDEGNFRVLIEKALGDALTSGGWLPEDTPDHYRFQAVTFDPHVGPKLTVISLHWTRP